MLYKNTGSTKKKNEKSVSLVSSIQLRERRKYSMQLMPGYPDKISNMKFTYVTKNRQKN